MKIGFETHVPLKTKTKLLSDEARGSESAYAAGEPGTRPVLQEKAIRHAVKLAVTLDMDVSEALRFDRKQYFYPDLPKGYQITQHRDPLATDGVFSTMHGDAEIKELHVEEDPSSTKTCPNDVLVDDTRSGEPLIELVTTPCFHSEDAAIAFLDELETHASYLGVLDTTKGFKTDINLSIDATDNTRVEVKNVTGKENIKHAIRYEAWRQRSAAEFGDTIPRETRHYDDEKRMTTPSREKETYMEYAFIPEPDIPAIPTTSIIEEVKQSLPKPRQTIIDELIGEGVSKQEATTIASHPDQRGLYEALRDSLNAPTAQTVITQHLPHILDAQDHGWDDIDTEKLRRTVLVAADHDLPDNTIKDMLWQSLFTAKGPREWVDDHLSDTDPEQTIKHLLAEHPSRVEAYKDGKEAVVNAFMGDLAQEHPDADKHQLIELIEKALRDRT